MNSGYYNFIDGLELSLFEELSGHDDGNI